MPVPKKRQSKSRTRMRRAHDALVANQWIACPNPACGETILPHHVCPHCGHYKGTLAIPPK